MAQETANDMDNSNVVIDQGKTSWSDLWKKDDFLAIWFGLAFCFLALYLYVLSYPAQSKIIALDKIEKANVIMQAEIEMSGGLKTIAYFEAQKDKVIKAEPGAFAKTFLVYMKGPGKWTENPLDAFVMSKEVADGISAQNAAALEKSNIVLATAYLQAQTAEAAAKVAEFKDEALNTEANTQISAWRTALTANKSAVAKTKIKPFNILPTLPVLMVGLGLLFGFGISLMGANPTKFFIGFIGLFIFTLAAVTLGNQTTMKGYGVGKEAWAIIIGMLIANTVGTPKWVKPALQVEFFIKTGLVILGASILMDKIVAIGIPGIFVAWIVTPIVLISTYIFGQKVIKMPSKTLNIVISADMSVCGTSAAIATAAACRAKKEELALSIGISLLFTAIMMIVMPVFIKAVGMPQVLGGAWIGGTIDATGAVAAAGGFLGLKAMYVAATIKMIQNVLIGVTAFGVAVYWVAKVDRVEGQKVSVFEIWHRFPKFVLGFLFASILFSYYSGILGPELSNALINGGVSKGMLSPMRGWCFTLSFAAIGLGTNFRELAHYFKGGKPVILYFCGQSFNLALTLLMAYIMFYLVFPEITASI